MHMRVHMHGHSYYAQAYSGQEDTYACDMRTGFVGCVPTTPNTSRSAGVSPDGCDDSPKRRLGAAAADAAVPAEHVKTQQHTATRHEDTATHSNTS